MSELSEGRRSRSGSRGRRSRSSSGAPRRGSMPIASMQLESSPEHALPPKRQQSRKRILLLLLLGAVLVVIAALIVALFSAGVVNGGPLSSVDGVSTPFPSPAAQQPTAAPTPMPTIKPEVYLDIVTNGVPLAEVVVAPDAPKLTLLAAEILIDSVEQATGAKLELVNSTSSNVDSLSQKYQIVIGQEPPFASAKDQLRDGGYLMLATVSHLYLYGDEQMQNRSAFLSEEQQDLLTAPDQFAVPALNRKAFNSKWGIYESDSRGVVNAVFAWLRSMGFRFYAPRSWGTILPQSAVSTGSLSFPMRNETINPATPLRDFAMFYYRFSHLREGIYPDDYEYGRADELLYFLMSLGLNELDQYVVGKFPHGLHAVTDREETPSRHPDYFAVWGGVRRDGTDGSEAKQNLCSEALVEATYRYAKAMHLIYGAKLVSIWPSDGFTRASEEPAWCLEQATPERGSRGSISDHVWGFVNSVGWLLKEDPEVDSDFKIICGAYSAYQLVPLNVTDPRGFADNIVAFIIRHRRDFGDAERKKYYDELADEWIDFLPSKLIFNYDHYNTNTYGRSTDDIAQLYPRAIAKDIAKYAGKIEGEFIETPSNWPPAGAPFDTFAAAAFNVYVTARFLWNAQLDYDSLESEYLDLFYGPASDVMRQYITYTGSYTPGQLAYDPHHRRRMRALVEEALALVPAGSDFASRLNNLLGQINGRYEGAEPLVDECRVLNSPGSVYKLSRDIFFNHSSGDIACFPIHGNDVALDCQGHTISHEGGYAVWLDTKEIRDKGDFFSMRNCRIETRGAASHSIYVKGSQFSNFTDLHIDAIGGSAGGIRGFGPLNNRFERNWINSTGMAIQLQYGGSGGTDVDSRNIIVNNECHSAGRTMYLYNPHFDFIANNTLTSTSSNDNALRILNPENVVMQSNFIAATGSNALFIQNPINVTQLNDTVINNYLAS